jgi:DTW domain-containing protein YfiP
MTRRKNEVARDQSKRDGRAQADALRAQGLSPPEVFAEITRRNLEFMRNEAKERGRCLQCWQTARHGCCICADMQPPLLLQVPMKIIIWCHSRDYLNAGDDAKLLPCCVAGRASTEMMLFGTPDDGRLAEAVNADPRRSLLLFPDETAITVQEYLRGAVGAAPPPDSGTNGTLTVQEPLTVVVLNGTWGNVKPMLRHFNAKIDPEGRIRHVALEPDTLSGAHLQRGGRSAAAQGVRCVCCTTSLSLFRGVWTRSLQRSDLRMSAAGEDDYNTDKLVEYVQLNNAALKGKRGLQEWRDRSLPSGGGEAEVATQLLGAWQCQMAAVASISLAAAAALISRTP